MTPSKILLAFFVFSLAFLPALIQRLPADSLATTILGGAYAGLVALAAWLNASPAPTAVAKLGARVRSLLGLPLALLAVLLLAGCLTTAQKAVVSQIDADTIDLTNAACAIAEPIVTATAPADAVLVTLTCDVVDATGAVVQHVVATVPPAKAAEVVRRHPRLAGTTAAESVTYSRMHQLWCTGGMCP